MGAFYDPKLEMTHIEKCLPISFGQNADHISSSERKSVYPGEEK